MFSLLESGGAERLRDCLGRFGKNVSEDHLIVFDHRVLLLLLTACFLFVSAVAFGVNGSSVGRWNRTITDNRVAVKSNVILGVARSIRSDEWAVATPFILSQARHGFPVENEALGAGKTPLVSAYSLPVLHYSTIFKPAHWAYFILDIERAFSFYWNYKVFVLILAFFFLLMLLTDNSFALSLVGSLWLFFSGYTQWWFSTIIPEIVIGFCIIIISFIYILYARKAILIFIAYIFFTVYSINYVLCFYPPSQIVLCHLGIFLIAGYVLVKPNPHVFNSHPYIRFSLGAASLSIVISVIALFYMETKDTIEIVRNTSYPGRRVASGGGMDIARYFSAFFDISIRRHKFHAILGNICEASNFLLLYPLAIVLFYKRNSKDSRNDWIGLSLLAYISILTIWMFWGLPESITATTLLSIIPLNRAMLGLGIAGVILTIRWVDRSNKLLGIGESRSEYGLSILASILILLLCIYANRKYDSFLAIWQVALVCAVFSFMAYALFSLKMRAFSALLFLAVFIPGAPVNPVCTGLSPLFDKDLNPVLAEIIKRDPNAGWLVYGDNPKQSFFIAQGAKVFNGVKYIPDLKSMKSLDPEGKYVDVYNRYAHIVFEPRNDDIVEFRLAGPDAYIVSINPLSDRLKALGVKYIVMPDKPSYYDIEFARRNGVTPLTEEPINSFWICKTGW
jgi:hypothetical protein